MDETNYIQAMQQDYPKDFADDDEVTAALLDACDSAKENNK